MAYIPDRVEKLPVVCWKRCGRSGRRWICDAVNRLKVRRAVREDHCRSQNPLREVADECVGPKLVQGAQRRVQVGHINAVGIAGRLHCAVEQRVVVHHCAGFADHIINRLSGRAAHDSLLP